jgi:predicted transcriptional regulator
MADLYSGLRNWFGVKRSGSELPPLGQRELAVLEILWARGPLSAQQVLARLPGAGVGLSTVQSTLERLSRKSILEREKAGRAYVYGARLSRSEIIGSLLRDIAQELAGGDRDAMISGFMDYLGDDAQGLPAGGTGQHDDD